MKTIKYLLIIVLILGVNTIDAKLKRTKLSVLIKKSEFIVKGKVVQSSLDDDNFSGSAIIKIQDVYKGNIEDIKITLSWSSEVHDQRLATVGEERIFFLKKINGKYTAASYGVSYIPLEYHQSNKSIGYFIEYKYPTNTIIIDNDNLLTGNDILKIKKDVPFAPVYSDSIIVMDDLIRIIKGEPK